MAAFLYSIATGLAFLFYLARVRRDPCRFGNAVLLGLALVLLPLALLAQTATGSAPAPLVAAMTMTVLLLTLGVFVLGSGPIGGSRVPPLPASRLDRARAVYE
ncbi:hypothetical protein [Streptomyces niveiscabiei]|uniref:hypothetical protein n=1 Tax=Streptomyces niveiscabiei TaxID=164115 RepID=UPI00389A8E7B